MSQQFDFMSKCYAFDYCDLVFELHIISSDI